MNHKPLNGIEMAENLARRKLGHEIGSQAYDIVNRNFRNVFENSLPLLEKPACPEFHKKIVELQNACNESGISREVVHGFLPIFLDKYESKIYHDCSEGQVPNLFVASNSSEDNIEQIYGKAYISDKKMHGNFGQRINIRKKEHLEDANDLVIFQYLLNHKAIPAAIVFHGSVTADSTGNCSLEKAAMLSHARKLRYMEAAQKAKHYVTKSYYLYGRENIEIPLISTVYDKETREVYFVKNNGRIGLPLRKYIENSGLVENDGRFKDIVNSLLEHEKDEYYTLAYKDAYAMKEIGCVDARIINLLVQMAIIKEMGSTLKQGERRRIVTSQLCSGIIDGGHTFCGYLTTLIAFHMAMNDARKIFGNRMSNARDMIELKLKQIMEGNVEPAFGAEEFSGAIEKAREASGEEIPKDRLELLVEFVSGTTNDLRKTVRHALKRGKAIFAKDGLFSFPAAEKIEDITKEVIPGIELTQPHFDLLVAEESQRENFEIYRTLLNQQDVIADMTAARGNSAFDIGLMIRDLRGGAKFMPPEQTPEDEIKNYTQKKQYSYFVERQLFYDPGVTVKIDVSEKKTHEAH
ncbi:MAG: hypothetical protein ABIH83_03625 [Candidatus Micrarchaeota archaeon]